MKLPVLNPSEMRFGTSWRRTAAAVFSRPTDGKVMGFVNLDFRPATEAIARWNAQGHRVTPMHIMMAIMARVLGRHVFPLFAAPRPRDQVRMLMLLS